MNYEVDFYELVTDISIDPNIQLEQCRFIFDKSGGTVNPQNKKVYPEVRGIRVFCKLESPPNESRKTQGPLENALYLAEEILTGLVAKTQGFAYLEKPVKCRYDSKEYVLEDSFWREQTPRSNIYQGGEAYIDDLSFIDIPKNFHPMFHFYRAAKDETSSKDYRALNAWRFLEALHGIHGQVLVRHLIRTEGQPRKTVEDFYANIRCAVAHANELKDKPGSDKVIIPRSYETEFDGGLLLDLSTIMKYLDAEVKKMNPQPDTTSR